MAEDNSIVVSDNNVPLMLEEIGQMFNDNLKVYQSKVSAPTLGIVRLDYDYPPSLGDIDCPKSFAYNVYYRTVPGLTFEICQSGTFTNKIIENFNNAIQWLIEEKKVSAITGDCGFMMFFQPLARTFTHLPVFMSSLCQLPAILCAFASHEEIIILTANGKALESMSDLIKNECGIDTENRRFHIIGLEDVKGFDAVAKGTKVDYEIVEPGIVRASKTALEKFPNSRAFLVECTEVTPYSDSIRCATGLPVFDGITACNFFMESLQDNIRFGKQDWQHRWDGKQETYEFGKELTETERAELVCRPNPMNRLKRAMDEINVCINEERNKKAGANVSKH